MNIHQAEPRFKSTMYFVEANSFEHLCLWERHNKETYWEDDTMGFATEVGSLGRKKPVWVSFRFDKIYGQRICFFDVTSRYVDHDMVKEFLERTCPGVGITDAMNFHHALHHCQDLQKMASTSVSS